MQIAISQTIKNECKDYFYITLGLLLYTFGWTIFLLPYQIVTGGVTGIAAVIYYGTGIPIYLSYFLINAALLLAALKILGFKFMVKTIYAIIMLSVFLALAQDWMIGEDGNAAGMAAGVVFVEQGRAPAGVVAVDFADGIVDQLLGDGVILAHGHVNALLVEGVNDPFVLRLAQPVGGCGGDLPVAQCTGQLLVGVIVHRGVAETVLLGVG